MLQKILLFLCLTCSTWGSVFAAPSTLAGGYHDISVNEQSVIDAADFATQQINQGVLVSILSAQSQVVAGINYKLLLEVVGNDGVNHIFSATVFVPLPFTNQPQQLIDFKDLGTTDSNPT